MQEFLIAYCFQNIKIYTYSFIMIKKISFFFQGSGYPCGWTVFFVLHSNLGRIFLLSRITRTVSCCPLNKDIVMIMIKPIIMIMMYTYGHFGKAKKKKQVKW